MIDMDPECSDWETHDDYLYFETEHWMKRADRVHIAVSDIPSAEGENHWQQTYDENRSLKWEPLRQLKKLVESAEYERNRRRREGREFWLKWFTAVVAALAAAASVLNVYLTSHRK